MNRLDLVSRILDCPVGAIRCDRDDLASEGLDFFLGAIFIGIKFVALRLGPPLFIVVESQLFPAVALLVAVEAHHLVLLLLIIPEHFIRAPHCFTQALGRSLGAIAPFGATFALALAFRALAFLALALSLALAFTLL